jgi:hypothetical protein
MSRENDKNWGNFTPRNYGNAQCGNNLVFKSANMLSNMPEGCIVSIRNGSDTVRGDFGGIRIFDGGGEDTYILILRGVTTGYKEYFALDKMKYESPSGVPSEYSEGTELSDDDYEKLKSRLCYGLVAGGTPGIYDNAVQDGFSTEADSSGKRIKFKPSGGMEWIDDKRAMKKDKLASWLEYPSDRTTSSSSSGEDFTSAVIYDNMVYTSGGTGNPSWNKAESIGSGSYSYTDNLEYFIEYHDNESEKELVIFPSELCSLTTVSYNWNMMSYSESFEEPPHGTFSYKGSMEYKRNEYFRYRYYTDCGNQKMCYLDDIYTESDEWTQENEDADEKKLSDDFERTYTVQEDGEIYFCDHLIHKFTSTIQDISKLTYAYPGPPDSTMNINRNYEWSCPIGSICLNEDNFFVVWSASYEKLTYSGPTSYSVGYSEWSTTPLFTPYYPNYSTGNSIWCSYGTDSSFSGYESGDENFTDIEEDSLKRSKGIVSVKLYDDTVDDSSLSVGLSGKLATDRHLVYLFRLSKYSGGYTGYYVIFIVNVVTGKHAILKIPFTNYQAGGGSPNMCLEIRGVGPDAKKI